MPHSSSGRPYAEPTSVMSSEVPGKAGALAPAPTRIVLGQSVHHTERGRGRVVLCDPTYVVVRWQETGALEHIDGTGLSRLMSSPPRRSASQPRRSRTTRVLRTTSEWKELQLSLMPAGMRRSQDGAIARGGGSPTPLHQRRPRRPGPVLPPPWRPVPEAFIELARRWGLRVEMRSGGFAIVSPLSPHGDLVRIRQHEDGTFDARPDAFWHPGDTDEHRLAVLRANAAIERYILRSFDLVGLAEFVRYLLRVGRELERTATATRATDMVRKPRHVSVHFVRGGAPGSGRRS